jgi:hypothetical protein
MSPDENASRAPREADTTEIPWARTTTMPTVASPHRDPGPASDPPAAAETGPPTSAPAVTPPTWSGKKTAIAAALAIGFSTIGAIGAAAALPAGASQSDGPGGRGFPGGGQFQPGGQTGQQGLPGQQGQQNQLGQQGFPGQQNQQNQPGPGSRGLPGGVMPGAPDDDGSPPDLDDGTSTT